MEEFTLVKNEENILETLVKWTICPGDIYWKKLSGKEVKLFHAGTFPSSSKIEKLQSSKMNLRIELSIDEKWCDEGVNQIFILKEAEVAPGKKEKLKSEARDEILKWAFPILWKGEEEKNLLGLVATLLKGFEIFDEETYELMSGLNTRRLQQSLGSASIGVLLALSSGYTTFSFLREYFLAQVLFDLSLEVGKLGEIGETYFKEESQYPGRGEKIISGLDAKDYDFLKKHMEMSFKIAEEKYKQGMNYPYLLKQIKIHHERLNGMGFPKGLNQNEMSDLEVISVVSGYLSDVPEFDLNKKLMKGSLKEVLDGNSETKATVLSFRLEKIFRNLFEQMGSQEDKYLEIAGL